MQRVVIIFAAFIQASFSLWMCSSDIDCDLQVGSVCVNGACQCPPGQEAVSGGSRCVNVSPYFLSPCQEERQCSRLWANYECRSENGTGTCQCMDGNHYFLGRCWRSRDFRESCNRDVILYTNIHQEIPFELVD